MPEVILKAKKVYFEKVTVKPCIFVQADVFEELYNTKVADYEKMMGQKRVVFIKGIKHLVVARSVWNYQITKQVVRELRYHRV